LRRLLVIEAESALECRGDPAGSSLGMENGKLQAIHRVVDCERCPARHARDKDD